MCGKLVYNNSIQRLDIIDENNLECGGLHCGDVIEVLTNNVWLKTRVEYSNDWYLFELYNAGCIPCNLHVRTV